jgi:hypothetical protein
MPRNASIINKDDRATWRAPAATVSLQPAAAAWVSDRPPMRVVVVADTHELHWELVGDHFTGEDMLPPGDLLVHCGDILRASVARSEAENRACLTDFNDWLGFVRRRYKHGVLVVAGNHDTYMQRLGRADVQGILTNATYLEWSGVVIDGVSFFGCPFSYGISNNRAFQDYPTDFDVRSALPDYVDVLISHASYANGPFVETFLCNKPQTIVDPLGGDSMKMRVHRRQSDAGTDGRRTTSIGFTLHSQYSGCLLSTAVMCTRGSVGCSVFFMVVSARFIEPNGNTYERRGIVVLSTKKGQRTALVLYRDESHPLKLRSEPNRKLVAVNPVLVLDHEPVSARTRLHDRSRQEPRSNRDDAAPIPEEPIPVIESARGTNERGIVRQAEDPSDHDESTPSDSTDVLLPCRD